MTLWTLFDDMVKQPLQGRFIGLGDEELNAATTRGVGTGQSDTVGACASSLRHPSYQCRTCPWPGHAGGAQAPPAAGRSGAARVCISRDTWTRHPVCGHDALDHFGELSLRDIERAANNGAKRHLERDDDATV